MIIAPWGVCFRNATRNPRSPAARGLDDILKARAEAGVTQAELAARIGTTQSAVARMETAIGKHSPSISTLKRYASALGYRLQVRLVKEQGLTTRSARTRRERRAG